MSTKDNKKKKEKKMSKIEKIASSVTDEEEVVKKMTIYEYEEKYSKKSNVKNVKLFLGIGISAIGVLLFFCFFSIAYKVFELKLDYNLNLYLGALVAVICILLYIFLFIVPIVKIFKLNYFITDVTIKNAKQAQLHNKKVRHELTDKIIDATNKIENIGWYDTETVGKLAICKSSNDEKGIKENLTKLYSGSIKKSAKDLIFKTSLKTAMYSAVSQTNKVDALLVAVLNLQLIKDIMFMYGFRPSDTKLLKIFYAVLRNSLIAYGLGGIKIGNTIVQTMGNAVKGIPLLGSAISTVIDSSIQGLTNGVLTAVIGRQTIKYLSQEYKLQDILDGIEIEESQQEFEQTCSDLKQELSQRNKKGRNKSKPSSYSHVNAFDTSDVEDSKSDESVNNLTEVKSTI